MPLPSSYPNGNLPGMVRSPEDTIVETEHIEAVIAAITVITQPITELYWKQAAKISSFEKKPENGGIPAMRDRQSGMSSE